MRVLFCNYEYPPLGGGGGVAMAAVAHELARRHEVTVLTSQALGLSRESMDEGVRVVRVPVFFRRKLPVANIPSMAAYLPLGFWRGLQLAGERPFDVINTHFVVPTGPLGDWLAWRLHVPNVLSVHGGDLFDPSKLSSPHRHTVLRVAVTGMLRRASSVVAQSRDTARHVDEFYGVKRQVEIVPLGIERPPENVCASRADFGIPENAFVLVTVGRLVSRKATTQLIDVLAAAGASDMYLVVVGDGPDRDAVEQRAQSAGVADRVRVLGYISDEDKYRVLSMADLFVSTSQHEGFGLVFLEAMAFGLPVICYDCGGQTDFLSTPVTGSVVTLNDVRAFTSAVLELHGSRDRLQEIRRNNLSIVRNYFIDRCARSYEAIFERAILDYHHAFEAARTK